MRKFCCFLLLSCILCSCHKNDGISVCISDMMSKKVQIPYDSMVYVSFKDEMDKDMYWNYTQTCKFRYIMYILEDRCSSCMINNLSLWNEMLGLSKQKKLQLVFIMAASSNEINDIKQAFHTSGLEYPIMIDTCGIFMRCNSYIPKNHLYQTFLIDSQDSIRLIGDPIHNKEIRSLMNKIVYP